MTVGSVCEGLSTKLEAASGGETGTMKIGVVRPGCKDPIPGFSRLYYWSGTYDLVERILLMDLMDAIQIQVKGKYR